MVHCGLMFMVFSRGLYLLYVILACVAFPKTRSLLTAEYRIDGSTYYIPLVLCEPGSVDFDGTTIQFDVRDIEGCTTLDYLVHASTASLLLSAAAVLLFLLVDAVSRMGRDGLSDRHLCTRGATVGMGVFLIIILIQAAISGWALAAECKFWEQTTQSFLEKMNLSEGIRSVETYGNESLLFATGAAAIFCSVVVLIEIIWFPKTDNADEDDGTKSTATTATSPAAASGSLTSPASAASTKDDSEWLEQSGGSNSSSKQQQHSPSWADGV